MGINGTDPTVQQGITVIRTPGGFKIFAVKGNVVMAEAVVDVFNQQEAQMALAGLAQTIMQLSQPRGGIVPVQSMDNLPPIKGHG